MSKLSEAFSNKKAFITYLMAGDPTLAVSRELILAAQDAGADMVEIGIPFSDPIAEGAVIQAASIRSLGNGANLDNIFEMVASLKDEVHIPLVFMTYLNPVFVYGYDLFFSKCREIGVSGIIVPDLPFEEQGEVKQVANGYGIDVVTLVAPTSLERIRAITEEAQGFLYLVSSMGVTGQRNSISTDIPALVSEIRKYSTIPVAVGFGIGTPEQAKHFASVSDGVIVGSAIVKLVEQYGTDAKVPVHTFINSMQAATHSS